MSFYRVSPTCQIPDLERKWEDLFGRKHDGFFVEVGAFDGESFSNTSCLADAGWGGIYVEPVPASAAKCRERHAANPNVRILEAGISNHSGTLELEIAGAYTTSNADTRTAYGQIDWASSQLTGNRLIVQTFSMDELLTSQYVPSGFDLLVVDVEGGEEKVFEGFDIQRWAPACIVVELCDVHQSFQDFPILTDSARRVRKGIIAAGYREYHRDEINSIFVK